MISITRWVRRFYVLWLAVFAAVFLTGCTSPPSVAPLLRVTEQALLDEADRLNEDVVREQAYTRQTLQSLEDAYGQDLKQTETLTPEWVCEATSVYVAAREAVLTHEANLARERDVRADNLSAAASATRRAITMLEQQDQLLNSLAGEDLRQFMTRFDDLRKVGDQ